MCACECACVRLCVFVCVSVCVGVCECVCEYVCAPTHEGDRGVLRHRTNWERKSRMMADKGNYEIVKTRRCQEW